MSAPAASKNDPNVALPPAVQALAAAAQARQEAYIAEMQAAQGQQPETPQDPQPSVPSVPVTPEVKEPAPPQNTPAPAGEDENTESFKQRFLSAQGRLEKAQQQNAQLAEQIAAMQRAITTLQSTPQPTGEPEPKSYKKLITEKEEEEFGTEFLDVVGRKAQETFEPIKAEYEAKIANLERQVKGVGGFVAQSAREQCDQFLDREIPNWREINYQDNFIAWLKLPDPYSGVIRMNTLKAAYDANDGPRVRNFFKGFLAEEAAMVPGGSQPNPAPAAAAAGKVPLESLAAPGRAKTAAASGAPTEKPFFTRAEVTQFYVDVANGRWRGKDAERIQRDRQIMEAGAEGRIR